MLRDTLVVRQKLLIINYIHPDEARVQVSSKVKKTKKLLFLHMFINGWGGGRGRGRGRGTESFKAMLEEYKWKRDATALIKMLVKCCFFLFIYLSNKFVPFIYLQVLVLPTRPHRLLYPLFIYLFIFFTFTRCS